MNLTTSPKVIGLDRYRASASSAEARANDNQNYLSDLALKLQQSIDIEVLLQIFCEETANIVPCDSVSYAHTNPRITFEHGKLQSNQCSYTLDIEGTDLGEIVCSRKTPFTIRETDLLERLLSLLIYPLRNALLYFQALDQAQKDPLTQIGNRSAFDSAMEKELCSFQRHQSDFSLMIIDIDHFKQVNDTYGHIAGDKVLYSVAQTIQKTIRRSDEVFRYGGEEFVVILSNTKQGGARFIAERVRKEIEKLCVPEHQAINVTASLGISSSELMRDVSKTLEHADNALYQAKDSGRNRVICYP